MQPLPLRSSSSIIFNFHLFQVKVHCIADRFQRLASPSATALALNQMPFCHKVHGALVSSSVHPSHCWSRLGGQMDSVKGCPGWTRVDTLTHSRIIARTCGARGVSLLTKGLHVIVQHLLLTPKQCGGQSIEILRSTQIQPCLREINHESCNMVPHSKRWR